MWGIIPLSEKEYKELKEKAEKSDEYYRDMREFQERNSNQAHQIRDLKKKLKAVKAWLTYAKAQGYISISQGERLDEILKGVDKEEEKVDG